MIEETARIPTEPNLEAGMTPVAENATAQPAEETPGNVNPNGSTDGQAAPPDTSHPREEDSAKEAKRLKDTQAALMQAKQELATLKRMLTPDVVAAMQTGQQVSGRDLLRKQLEAHPEIIDDPVSQMQFTQNMTQNQVVQMLKEHEAKLEFANEVKTLIPEINLRDPAIDECYRKVRAEYLMRGIDENPFLAAFAVAYPKKAYALRNNRGKAIVDEASKQAASRLEKPGPGKEPQGTRPVVVETNDPNWFQAYVVKNHPGIASK